MFALDSDSGGQCHFCKGGKRLSPLVLQSVARMTCSGENVTLMMLIITFENRKAVRLSCDKKLNSVYTSFPKSGDCSVGVSTVCPLAMEKCHTGCESYTIGHLNRKVTAGGCRDCIIAQNEFNDNPGQTCRQCPAGYEACPQPGDKTTSYCVAGGKWHIPGTACRECADNFFSTQTGACKACPEGWYSNSGDPTCIECPLGQWRINVGARSQQVGPGFTQRCTGCTGNVYFKEGRSFVGCSSCPTGQYRLESDDLRRCQLCPAGYGVDSSTTAGGCSICPLGYAKSKLQLGCTKCEGGQYADAEGLETCKDCPYGWSPEKSPVRCTECPKGKFADPDKGCDDCPRGYYGYYGIEKGFECQSCPEGQTAEPGSVECFACEEGKFLSGAGGSCFQCDMGYEPFGNECSRCQSGKFKDQPGCRRARSALTIVLPMLPKQHVCDASPDSLARSRVRSMSRSFQGKS